MTKTVVLVCFLLLMRVDAFTQSKTAEISTSLGTMTFRLYDDTPRHRDAFIQLAREGYYNGTLFYRVIENFLIQGGSKSSRDAAPGKRIGYGDPDKTVNDEILKNHFHKKGALCAPRQPDELNPFKQSDISQFYIIEGKIYSDGELDTLELAVNRPIRNKIVNNIMTPAVRDELKKLKDEKKVDEFRELAQKVKDKIEADYSLNPNVLVFSDEQRKAYTTIGGYPDLDGKFTIFGECISGFEVIDKISVLKTDKNDRPVTDVKITSVRILAN